MAVIYENWEPHWNEVSVLSRPRTLTRSMLDEYIEIRNDRRELVNNTEYSERFEIWQKVIGRYD